MTVDPLDMGAPGVARPDRFLVERIGDRCGRIVQESACGSCERDVAWRPIGARALGDFDQAEVGVAGRGRVIGFMEAKERPGRRRAGSKRRRLRLHGRASGLKLQARRRQARPKPDAELVGVPMARAHELAKIGREAGSAFEAAMLDPGICAALR